MRRIINTQKDNVLDITFWPTDICNYSCDYCYPGSTPGTNRYVKNLDELIAGFDALFKAYSLYHSKNDFRLSIAGGGEPSIWPFLPKFCEHIKILSNPLINLTTNASRKIAWWKKIVKYIDSVAVSCHHKEVNIDHLITVCDFLYEKNVEVTVQVLMDPLAWNKCLTLVDKLQQSKYSWFIQAKPVVSKYEYNEQQKNYFKIPYKRLESAENLLKKIENYNVIKSVELINDKANLSLQHTYISEKRNNFNGWKCYFPKERVSIDILGNIKGSCGTKFSTNLNIFDKMLFEKLANLNYVICALESCNCLPETHITKEQLL